MIFHLFRTQKGDLPPVTVDFCISVGRACRPAHYLRENGLRICSNPLDWMMYYDLPLVIDLFTSEFRDFFKDREELDEVTVHHRTVKDTASGMVAMHNFPLKYGVDEYYPTFLREVRRRYFRMISYMEKSDTILFLCNRNLTDKEAARFLHEVHALVPRRYIMYNVKNNLKRKKITVRSVAVEPDLYFVECEFNDTHPDGASAKNNPLFWLGNAWAWNQVLASISLSARLDRHNAEREDTFFR